MSKQRIKWSKELVIENIKELQIEGEPLNASHVMRENGRLYGAARKHFNSWRGAVEAAGIDYSKVNLRSNEKRWSKDVICNEIKKLAEQGEPLNSDYIQKNYTKLHSAAQRYFKSWGNAVEEAGFNYDSIKGLKWTEETVTEEVLRLAEEGVDLSSSNMQEEYMSLFQAGCRIYGSWKNTVNSSGLNYNDYRKQKEWDKPKVLQEIRNYVEENGPASVNLISRDYGALYQAARRNYPGLEWEHILALAFAEAK